MKPEIENSNLSPPDAAVTAGDDDNFEFRGDDDFEFPFVAKDNESGADGITADGRVRLVYPLFDRDLLRGGGGDAAAIDFEVEEREAYPRSGSVSSTSSGDDVEETRSVPASPGWCKKKSRSTGSASSRRWRLRDLVIGRSHSDGKDKFVFLASAAGKKKSVTSTSEALPAAKGSKGKVTETDMATAHRLYYRKGAAAAGGGGAGRRSFLPYKQDLVGFLGLSRTHRF